VDILLANFMIKVWDKVLSSVQSNINKQSFDMWLKNTVPVSINDNIFTVRVPDEVARKHITDHYKTVINDIIKSITGEVMICEFVTENVINESSDYIESAKENSNKSGPLDMSETSFTLNPEYTFDNFVVGPNNQLAQAASYSVSRSPATRYNPLFIYGGTGLGKTHLMQAIGHYIIKEKPFLKVLYVSFENYLNEFLYSIRTGTQSSFKIKYRNVDILLIDDIQFIEKKEQTQEEFFHTFNSLHNNKKQIVISSDRPPKELSTLEDRLRTRFEWGLITDIQPPNLETREAILKNKSEKYNIAISNDVLNYVARRIKSNIRALESALARLNQVSEIFNEPININHAKMHLKDLFDVDENRKITLSIIMTKVAERYDVTVDDLLSKSRHSKIVQPRFIAMYLARKLTDMTTTDIGKEFGNRDHSTVLNATANIEKIMKDTDEIKEQIEEIISDLKS
jgi:chromosomal replication initiator protein